MASSAAGENDGDQRKRSRKDHNSTDRDLPENVVEEHRSHRRHFRDSDRRRPERRRSRSRSPPAARNGRRRRRSSDMPPRPRSSFQHDEHCSAARDDESSVRRAFERGRWNGPREPEDKFRAKVAPSDLEEEKSLAQTDHSNVWKHNGYHESEVEAQPTRKRPAFRETKTTVEEAAARTETIRPPRHERPVSNSYRREDERNNNSRLGRNERTVAGIGDRDLRRADAFPGRTENPRYGYQSRERYNGATNYRVRGDYNGRHNGRNALQSGGFQVEKWKHDLFDDANRSPKHKSEEEHIAKVEALLAL